MDDTQFLILLVIQVAWILFMFKEAKKFEKDVNTFEKEVKNFEKDVKKFAKDVNTFEEEVDKYLKSHSARILMLHDFALANQWDIICKSESEINKKENKTK